MKSKTKLLFYLSIGFILMMAQSLTFINDGNPPVSGTPPVVKHYLYVATPAIRSYLGFGGHGLLVFDIDNNHKFVKRIATGGLMKDGTPSNVKGIAVSIPLNSVYISTLEAVQRIDLTTEKIVWEIQYPGGCDRLAVSPDGKTIYLPSLEKTFWNVVDAATGSIITKIQVVRRAHNTIYGLSGKHVYMDDIASPWLWIADTKTNTIVDSVGKFGNFIRPFTINGKETLAFCTVDSLLGFEVGDLKTGKKIARIVVEGFETGPVKRHGCPSHGIGLTPDEKEVWVCDGHNEYMHVFSAVKPFQQLTSIKMRDMAGWITFSIDGKYAYCSSGDVIDVKTRKVVAGLEDEFHNNVQSEKEVEIDFSDNKVVKAGDQFGVGRVIN